MEEQEYGATRVKGDGPALKVPRLDSNREDKTHVVQLT